MGKGEEEQPFPSNAVVSETWSNQNNVVNPCAGVPGLFGCRCILVLLLSAAVLLSAIFWLPPFLKYGDQTDLDLDSQYGDHRIVASFEVEKPVSLLEENIWQLEGDINDEIGAPTTKVVIISLEPSSAGSNITKVVFAVDPDVKNSGISLASQSLIRASFVDLVIRHSSLRLTTSLFGDPFLFEVLKFPSGITVIPLQSAFLLQKVQILFNFTLNFSIYQIQEYFNELTSQLKSGLHLAPYENLYISLTNSKGSTVASPTTVQTSVLLAVGNTPSRARLKELAQTITGSHSKNLGLNNTVFGKVKQVSLSSILQHSLHGGDGSPSPAPLPHPYHHNHRHRHRHHHHHHHHHDAQSASSIAPVPATQKGAPSTEKSAPAPGKGSPVPEKISPAPAPAKSYEARPPGCGLGYKRRFKRKARKESHLVPTVAPMMSPEHSAASPHLRVDPPVPASPRIPIISPLPNVIFAHVQPPSQRESDTEPPDIVPSVLPLPYSSSGRIPPFFRAFPVCLALVLYL